MKQARRDRRTSEFVLLYLIQQPFHGFELYKKINKVLKSNKVDTAGIYRTLDKLENAEMVTFKWVKGDKGPDKKLYSITPEGAVYLQESYEIAGKIIFDLTIFTQTYEGLLSKM